MVDWVNLNFFVPLLALSYLLFYSYMKTLQLGGKKRKYEVHFPHNYVQYHPWGEIPAEDTTLLLPVSTICHVTHEQQASEIAPHHDGHYRFKPHKKYGKSYVEDGRPLGESYRCILNQIPDSHTPCYQSIPDTEPVFPGYYSWWGLAVDPPPDLSWVPRPDFLPGYLKTPPQSFYGRKAFVSSFSNLLQLYASSRGCEDIYLKVGGTLRYAREIAYVVIVCTSNDLGALNSYNPITFAPHVFDPRGLVDDSGKVTDMASVPHFITRYINASSYSYETLHFGDDLKFPTGTLTEVDVDHYCTRTQPMKWYHHRANRVQTNWKCPDEITEADEYENDRIRFCERFGYPI